MLNALQHMLSLCHNASQHILCFCHVASCWKAASFGRCKLPCHGLIGKTHPCGAASCRWPPLSDFPTTEDLANYVANTCACAWHSQFSGCSVVLKPPPHRRQIRNANFLLLFPSLRRRWLQSLFVLYDIYAPARGLNLLYSSNATSQSGTLNIQSLCD